MSDPTQPDYDHLTPAEAREQMGLDKRPLTKAEKAKLDLEICYP